MHIEEIVSKEDFVDQREGKWKRNKLGVFKIEIPGSL